jgi:hypothetical protein
MMEGITSKLEEYKANLANLFARSRLLPSDTDEEKERIRLAMELPFESLSMYRYYKLDDKGYVLSDLRNARMTVSSPKLFNDPYDSLLYLDKEWLISTLDRESLEQTCEIIKEIKSGKRVEDINPGISRVNAEICERLTALPEEEVKKIFFDERLTENAMRAAAQFIEALRHHNRIACFSEVDNSPLLWAHYADCGRGICIEYHIPKISPQCVFPYIDFKDRKIISSFLPVLYSNERYNATHIVNEYNEQLLILMMERQKDYKILTAEHDLLDSEKTSVFKSSDWAYEREWRLILYPFTATDPDRVPIVSPIIKSVILGNAMLDSQIELVLDALRTRIEKTGEKIDLKRLVLNTDSQDYSLKTVPFKM